MESVPNEIIAEILGWLPCSEANGLVGVCKLWHRIIVARPCRPVLTTAIHTFIDAEMAQPTLTMPCRCGRKYGRTLLCQQVVECDVLAMYLSIALEHPPLAELLLDSFWGVITANRNEFYKSFRRYFAVHYGDDPAETSYEQMLEATSLPLINCVGLWHRVNTTQVFHLVNLILACPDNSAKNSMMMIGVLSFSENSIFYKIHDLPFKEIMTMADQTDMYPGSHEYLRRVILE